MKEYILCAAIHYEDGIEHENQPCNIITGVVICGRRHHNCYGILNALSSEKKPHLKVGSHRQGFITNLDRYVGREEAYRIAKEANQLIRPDINTGNPSILTSEELY